MLHKCSILKTASVFFNEPTKQHYLIEISRKSNLAHTSTKANLEYLKSLSIIVETNEKKGSRDFPIFSANLSNKKYKEQKRLFNLIKLNESGLINFLADNLMPKSIVVFGSYLKGEDVEDSDIDLFIECKKKDLNISKFRGLLNRNIQLHFKDNFGKFPNNLKNNILNGFVLKGYLEVF